MDKLYRVIYTGDLRSGFALEDVTDNLVALTKMDRARAEQFLAKGKPAIIRKGLDREKAERYRESLQKAGLRVRIDRMAEAPVHGPGSTPPPAPESHQSRHQKKPESPAVNETVSEPAPKHNDSQFANPYASPKADLRVEKVLSGSWLAEPQKVAASRGWYWIKTATAMFFAAPWKWMGMLLITAVITLLVNFLPIVGPLVTAILGIVLGGGIMMAADDLAHGRVLLTKTVFKGFSHNRNQLIMVGVLYLAVFFIFGIIMAVVLGTSLLTVLFGGGNPEEVAIAMQSKIPLLIALVLIVAIVSIPLFMAYWFATPLVAVSDQKAWKAYKLSLRACSKNWLAFLVYGLALMVIGILAFMAFSLLSGLFAYLLSADNAFFIILPIGIMSLLGIPAMAITALSVYTGFKDIFYRHS